MLRKDFLQKIGYGSALALLGPTGLALVRNTDRSDDGTENKLSLDDGYSSYSTPDFNLILSDDSQTLVSLKPKEANGFDFVPSDRVNKRSGNDYYYLGDITMRLRKGGSGKWETYSTAEERHPVKQLKKRPSVLAGANLNPTLPDQIPLNVNRYWEIQGIHLVLRYELENITNKYVEIGSLGIPMVFNNILTKRSLEEASTKCSFYDPNTGLDGGHLQVTRLNGQGPSLVVVPEQNAQFEAYRPLKEDRTRRGITFEGFHEWMVYTKAYAENEWKNVDHWNPATSVILKQGEKKTFAIKFLLADQIRKIEDTLIKNDRPVAVGIPGYIVPKDQECKLFLSYSHDVKSINVEPAGAFSVKEIGTTKNGWKEYHISGQKWGRARLVMTYKDGLKQSINYKIIKPQRQVLSNIGSFLFTKQWFNEKDDLFDRNPAPISYDYFEQKQVKQEKRAWIAGLSDEGGNGSWVASVMKQLIEPDKQEIDKLQKFVDEVLDGRIQYKEGDKKYGVKKSMFYYDPDKMPEGTYNQNINFGGWESWSKKEAYSVGRSYDYTPVAAAYWVFYRLARNYDGLVTNHSWEWYLKRAFHTVIAMEKHAPAYARWGQMEGTIFVKILQDLKLEGWNSNAFKYEKVMRKRADYWKRLAYPYGSEMPWDSTGQEEVYAWCHYFGYDEKAKVTIDAITGYMPAIPHWGYNGNARRYWDFVYAGKLQRIERQIHHYGSGLNAVPVLTAYRNQPDDIHLLRIGYGGLMGAISNVTEEGFGPCAFHSYPETLKIDSYSGDYGPNFLGHVINTGTYVIRHPEFGWLTFGGNQQKQGDQIEIIPLDSSQSRVYLAPKGLWLTLEAGKFKKVRFNSSMDSIRLILDVSSKYVFEARLRISQPGSEGTRVQFKPMERYKKERGCYIIPLNDNNVQIELGQSMV